MKNVKNAIGKTASVNTAKIVKLNLSAFTDKLAKMQISEKTKNERDSIYIYPELLKVATITNEKERKQFRNSLRNKIRNFTGNILLFAKHSREEELIAEVNKFIVFYKENYVKNDFSLSSLSQSTNENKTGEIKAMLDIAQSVNVQISSEKASKTPTKKATKK